MNGKMIELPNEIIYMIMEQLYKLNKSIMLKDLIESTRNINYILNLSINADDFKYTRNGKFWIMIPPQSDNYNAVNYYKYITLFIHILADSNDRN